MNNILSIEHRDLTDALMTIPSESLNKLREELVRVSLLRGGAYMTHDHVIRLPLDHDILLAAKQMAERYYTSNLKYIILIGIGGQNLGVKAIYDALRGSLAEVRVKEEILISLSSKSGGTTETIANFELLRAFLNKHIDGIDQRIVVTTDAESPLHKVATKMGYGILLMPQMVGGRFSVFSHAGIFPLLLAGIDVISLLDGARGVLDAERESSNSNQTAKFAAESIFREMTVGHCNILNIFHFHPELESLGKWERQLIAESLGKKNDISGREIRSGITPIVSIGSTDLHSMAQLYFGGPKDKMTIIVRANRTTTERIPSDGVLHDVAPALSMRSPVELNDAIYQGVVRAYHKNKLPVVLVTLPSVSAVAIGAYMEWRMLVVIYLATLLHVDPYNQPNVEDYKEETRVILGHLGKK